MEGTQDPFSKANEMNESSFKIAEWQRVEIHGDFWENM